VNTVREDPKRKGLLYAGTERAVYFSIDDGDHWHSLRMNMPATSIRDLVIHEDDVVVGTHGRSFWILDDVTHLRQLDASKMNAPVLYAPQQAWRVRRSLNTDTPIPPEEPMGQNPPTGAIVNYWLPAAARSVVLEIVDRQGRLARRYESGKPDSRPDEKSLPHPSYWVRKATSLRVDAGMQRWVWDLRYGPLEGFAQSYPIAAIYGDTPPGPQGPLAGAGEYTVKLTVDGALVGSQKLVVKMDPRVKTTALALAKTHDLALQSYLSIVKIREMQREIQQLKRERPDDVEALSAIEGQGGGGRRRGGAASTNPTLASLAGDFLNVMSIADEADMAPTAQMISASAGFQRTLLELRTRLDTLKKR